MKSKTLYNMRLSDEYVAKQIKYLEDEIAMWNRVKNNVYEELKWNSSSRAYPICLEPGESTYVKREDLCEVF